MYQKIMRTLLGLALIVAATLALSALTPIAVIMWLPASSFTIALLAHSMKLLLLSAFASTAMLAAIAAIFMIKTVGSAIRRRLDRRNLDVMRGRQT